MTTDAAEDALQLLRELDGMRAQLRQPYPVRVYVRAAEELAHLPRAYDSLIDAPSTGVPITYAEGLTRNRALVKFSDGSRRLYRLREGEP